jgi:outer membrane protein assembly factor BamE (lipoprotein component of BamABCDE complex)
MKASAKRAVMALAVVAVLGGCNRIRDHKGYVVDTVLVDSVAPGVDTRDSVSKTLGRPSFASQWDNGSTWYYVARDTRQLAFSTPTPVTQTLLAVHFAANGEVASVNKTGLETIRDVALYSKKTPVRGSNRGFFTELFGNVAAGGNGQTGPTADNPGN